MSNKKQVCAIIVAAGEGRRMGGVDKAFAPLSGKPLLAWSVDVFEECPSVHRIVVVVRQQDVEQTRQLAAERAWSKVTGICAGGKQRQDSVANGLKGVERCDWVVVHDGARPLVTGDLIKRGLEAAGETGAAAAAVPVTDTIKLAMEDMIVQGTPPRHNLWAVQTPQVFRFDVIAEAYQRAKYQATDDASLVEQSGHKVKLYIGAYENIKVTTPDDLAIAGVLVRKHGR